MNLDWVERAEACLSSRPELGKWDTASSSVWWEQEIIKSDSMIFVLPSACIFENKLSCRRTYQAQILPPLVRMRKQLGTKATSLSWRLQDSAEKRNLPKDQLENLLPCWLPQQIVTLISSSGKGAGKSTVHTNTTSGSLQPALSGA